MEGQMMPDERAALMQEVVTHKPHCVLEVGTWKGGGSTYHIAAALVKNKRGHLYTCEVNPDFYHEAVRNLTDAGLGKHISFHLKPSGDLIQDMLRNANVPDFMFFDGGEDPQSALDDFVALDQHVKSGCIFSMHDWLHDLSIKQRLLKPYLEGLATWEIYKVLTPPNSVGLVFARKK